MHTTTFNREDYSFDEWPIFELGLDRISARRFWATVLQFADADSAESVHFRPHCGDDCLWCMLDGAEHQMVPPPAEFRKGLLGMGRELLAGNKWREQIWCVSAILTRRSLRGRLVVERNGKSIAWIGECSPPGTNAAIILSRDVNASAP